MKVYMAKVFQNGGSQAVRIPAEFRFPEGAELHIYREANSERVVLSPTPPPGLLASFARKMLSGEIQPTSTHSEAQAELAEIRAMRRQTDRD